jgi:competence CoiA-like predicted nuclease
MALTAYARLKGSNEEHDVIDITRYSAPRLELVNYELCCPECRAPMHVYQSMLRTTHFRHNQGYGDRDCALATGEGFEHIGAKIAVSNKLASMPMYRDARIVKEHWIASVSRRADICALCPGGFDVHEIQLAKITVDSLESRTNDYIESGATEIIWWFGGDAHTEANIQWAKRKLGGYGELNFSEDRELIL